MADNGESTKGTGFRKFATPRIIGGIGIAVVVLWALTHIFGSSEEPQVVADNTHIATPSGTVPTTTGTHAAAPARVKPAQPSSTTAPTGQVGAEMHASKTDPEITTGRGPATTHGADAAHEPGTDSGAVAIRTADDHAAPAESTHAAPAQPAQPHDQTTAHGAPAVGHDTGGHAAGTPQATAGHPLPDTVLHKPTPKGVAFVEAAIKPLQYELEERWWGWRCNDLINLTDNVNMFQLGVLEVTRRTTVALAERIARTGSTDSFDENLEEAMNWFMVKATSFWFPSAESKYRDGLEELEKYLEKLKVGRATFYTRTDNLIPLLASFEDLMGSCDENLVKQTNEDGSPMSTFAVDNYFYYTKGVADAMATVLGAVHHDFLLTLESRHGTELLHHAIISCQQAAALDPWIVLNKDLSSVFANHRANMAAPISHARFYLGQLIKTLST
jgi:hypothetical protein